ncbi:MAG: hypothetical protein WC797_02570 [Candidatus Paceibacterota bacterium]|jgi:hypothetical protein
MIKKQKQIKAGFIMLFTILVSGVVLAAALGISRIVVKEILLASIGADSQQAFFAADSGAECALYWNKTGKNRFATDTPASLARGIECNGFVLGNDESNPLLVANSFITGQGDNNIIGGADKSVFAFSLEPAAAPDTKPGCAIVTVDKSHWGVTTISSRGYNTCGSSRRRVERALEVTITNR